MPRKMRQVQLKFLETLNETIHVKTKLTLRPLRRKNNKQEVHGLLHRDEVRDEFSVWRATARKVTTAHRLVLGPRVPELIHQ